MNQSLVGVNETEYNPHLTPPTLQTQNTTSNADEETLIESSPSYKAGRAEAVEGTEDQNFNWGKKKKEAEEAKKNDENTKKDETPSKVDPKMFASERNRENIQARVCGHSALVSVNSFIQCIFIMKRIQKIRVRLMFLVDNYNTNFFTKPTTKPPTKPPTITTHFTASLPLFRQRRKTVASVVRT